MHPKKYSPLLGMICILVGYTVLVRQLIKNPFDKPLKPPSSVPTQLVLQNHFKTSLASDPLIRHTFQRIYINREWGHYAQGSGPGSTLEYTGILRQHLFEFLREHNVTSLLDSSCGSMFWLPEVLRTYATVNPSFRFLGLDVACDIIEQHKLRFENDTQWSFRCLDYTREPLPPGYDLILSRDSLQHLPVHYALQFLSNVKSSMATYVMVGSYLEEPVVNTDSPVGGYYSIDLTRAPFHVKPAPYKVYREAPDPVQKFMLVWKVDSMHWAKQST